MTIKYRSVRQPTYLGQFEMSPRDSKLYVQVLFFFFNKKLAVV